MLKYSFGCGEAIKWVRIDIAGHQHKCVRGETPGMCIIALHKVVQAGEDLNNKLLQEQQAEIVLLVNFLTSYLESSTTE